MLATPAARVSDGAGSASACISPPMLHGGSAAEAAGYGSVLTHTLTNWRTHEAELASGSFARLTVVHNARLLLPRRSHAYNWTSVAFNDTFAVGEASGWWRLPTADERAARCKQHVDGPALVWNSWQADYHYAHFLVNHLPMIYWLAERTPPDTRVLIGTCTWCADSLRHRTRRFLSWFDPSLAKRVSWISMEQMTCVSGPLYVAEPTFERARFAHPSYQTNLAAQAPYTLQSPRLLARVSLTPMRLHAASTEGDDAYPSVIYYSRRAPENGNGRLFNSNHDEMLPRLISSRMKHFNRGERFVFFNGRQTGEYPRPGYPMTAAQQLALFRTANLFIGPHGTAFANVLWMRPARGSEGCETHHQRLPHVIEFVCGAGSAAVREGCPYVRSYYYMLGGAAWVNWHHVLYTPRATAGVVKVDFGEVKNALDAILKHLPPTNLPPHWSTIEGVTGPPLVSEAAVWLRRTGGGQNESRQVDEDDDIPKNITGWTGWRQFMMLETLPN